jgi:hypothetical protein
LHARDQRFAPLTNYIKKLDAKDFEKL